MKKSLSATAFAWSGVTRAILVGALLLTAGKAMAAGKVGEMAADWSGLKGLDNKTYNLKDFRGKVLLLMTVQYNCGGCRANAPRIGSIAKSFQGNSFQAIGPDINYANATDLGSFGKLLRATPTDTSLNFPLLSGLKAPDIKDSTKNGSVLGTMWVPYDALRDVYFVIDHLGKIVYRLDGNRGNAVDTSKYTALTKAIATAISNIPSTSISIAGKAQGLCLQACKQNGAYLFDFANVGAAKGQYVTLKIMDPQGRIIRTLDWNRNSAATGKSQAIWDGRDSEGSPAAWGNYFINASAPGQSSTLLFSWLP